MKRNIRIALYEPEIAGNVGSIIRACSCFNTELILIEPLGFILTNKELKRSSMDYQINITIVKSVDEFFKTYKDRKILFTPHSSLSIEEIKIEDNDIFLFGRESNGIEISVAENCELCVSIPMKDNCRSFSLTHSVMVGLHLAAGRI